MRKRYVVLGLSVVLALALAVPAFGGPTNPLSGGLASVKKTANKALKNANAAKKSAKSALTAAESATAGVKGVESDVTKAQGEIKKLQTSVTNAQNTANGATTAAAGAKKLAEEAKAAAAAAEANANTRIKDSVQKFGTTSASSEANKFASVSCEGLPTLGGGYEVGGASNKVVVNISEEALYEDGWFVGSQQINGQTGAWTLRAIAICGTR
jgi:hypothetical protein